MLRSVNVSKASTKLLLRNKTFDRLQWLRYASSSLHSTVETDGSHLERPEGFGNSLFIWGGASIIGLALYQTFAPSTTSNSLKPPITQSTGGTDLIAEGGDEQKPWLTRYLSYHFASDPTELKKINDHNMAVVFESSDKAFFKSGIEKPAIRRLRNAGGFDIASPYGLVPGAQTDFSDLKIRSYQEDCRAPSLPEKSTEEES